jgi:putative FmdB family regulatory protein
MPIYDYSCRGCGHRFELLVLPQTSPKCPKCAGNDLEQLISAFAVSSEGTRAQALQDGRRRHARIKRDQDHAAAEYEKNHEH